MIISSVFIPKILPALPRYSASHASFPTAIYAQYRNVNSNDIIEYADNLSRVHVPPMNPYDDTDDKFVNASILLCCHGCIGHGQTLYVTLADNGIITDVYSTSRDVARDHFDWFQIAKKHIGRIPDTEFFTIIQHIESI